MKFRELNERAALNERNFSAEKVMEALVRKVDRRFEPSYYNGDDRTGYTYGYSYTVDDTEIQITFELDQSSVDAVQVSAIDYNGSENLKKILESTVKKVRRVLDSFSPLFSSGYFTDSYDTDDTEAFWNLRFSFSRGKERVRFE